MAKWFPNLFAEALIPINPHKWPSFVAGSAMASNMPDLIDKLDTPRQNLIVAKEYLASSKSDIQWRDRVYKVVQDTVSINFSCELGGDLGAFGAGAMSEKISDGYMDEMVKTSLTLNPTEKLNTRLFKQTAHEMGVDANLVTGTGAFRQFVKPINRGNILDRPPRNARPLWAKKPYSRAIQNRGRGPLSPRGPFSGPKGPLGFITPFIINERSALRLAKRLLSQQSYAIVQDSFGVYCYYRYAKFIYKVGKTGIPILYKNLKPKIVSLKRKFWKKT